MECVIGDGEVDVVDVDAQCFGRRQRLRVAAAEDNGELTQRVSVRERQSGISGCRHLERAVEVRKAFVLIAEGHVDDA